MEKSKVYNWTKFPPEVICEGKEQLLKCLPKENKEKLHQTLSINRQVESWNFDEEAEYFSEYRKDFKWSTYACYLNFKNIKLFIQTSLYSSEPQTEIVVSLPTRSEVEGVFSIFEKVASQCSIPKPPTPPEIPWESKVKIFIGHGRKVLWRDLKDHLSDQHNFKVEAYEIGARAGLTIKEILDEMLTKSSFAILVLTGENEDKNGVLHARDNVIHEVGLFQGRLGFRRAIVLLEEGVCEYSNILGIHQIRFSKDRIRETFGDVLATIKREFKPEDD